MDNFRALPKLNEKLEEMVSSGEARLATVVASYGNEVEVIVTGGARARFPSTHYDPPVGSSGALIATRGGGRLFTPMGVAIPIPFAATSGSMTSTTSLTTYSYSGTDSVSVSPGVYEVTAMAVVPVKRSVATGGISLVIDVGGATETVSTPIGTIMGADQFYPMGIRIQSQQITVAANGTVPLRFGYQGSGTAGTTSIYRAVMTGTLTRIG